MLLYLQLERSGTYRKREADISIIRGLENSRQCIIPAVLVSHIYLRKECNEINWICYASGGYVQDMSSQA